MNIYTFQMTVTSEWAYHPEELAKKIRLAIEPDAFRAQGKDAYDPSIRVSSQNLALSLESIRDEHLSKAREYEKGGNAQGAAQLRAVANLLQAMINGQKPATVLP